MYVERGGGLASRGGMIALVRFSQTGRTIYYGDVVLQSLNGSGYKSNHFDVTTGEHYWVSAPRRDGNDTLYPGIVEIDDEVREQYWLEIRCDPSMSHVAQFRAPGKYSRRRPHVELAVHGQSRTPRSSKSRLTHTQRRTASEK